MFSGFWQMQPLTLSLSNDGELEASTGGSPSEHATDQPKARRKPRAKYFLSAAQLQQRRNAAKNRAKTFTKEHQSRAGKALARKKGNHYMQELGTKGGEIARARYPDLAERGGEANWERIKRLRLEATKAEGQGKHGSEASEPGQSEADGS